MTEWKWWAPVSFIIKGLRIQTILIQISVTILNFKQGVAKRFAPFYLKEVKFASICYDRLYILMLCPFGFDVWNALTGRQEKHCMLDSSSFQKGEYPLPVCFLWGLFQEAHSFLSHLLHQCIRTWCPCEFCKWKSVICSTATTLWYNLAIVTGGKNLTCILTIIRSYKGECDKITSVGRKEWPVGVNRSWQSMDKRKKTEGLAEYQLLNNQKICQFSGFREIFSSSIICPWKDCKNTSEGRSGCLLMTLMLESLDHFKHPLTEILQTLPSSCFHCH